MIVDGQVHGGVTHGIGQALMEGAIYDDEGQLVNGSYMDYALPRADDLPSFETGRPVTPCPHNPLGVPISKEALGVMVDWAAGKQGVHIFFEPAKKCRICDYTVFNNFGDSR